MSDYKRFFVPGGTYFFTLVTAARRPVFQNEKAVRLLGSIMRAVLTAHPAETIAIVVLPDHLHAIWALPSGDCDYSMRWRNIKRDFTIAWLASGGHEPDSSSEKKRESRRGVWQRRFWEHTIRDEYDLEAHFDYVHYNPVKHGLVPAARDWPWSTFHRYVATGHYPPTWATAPDETRLKHGTGE
ncbi:MAG: transposase [Pirellulales bacterium]|nr:transposase [Pirellulales bacterium]